MKQLTNTKRLTTLSISAIDMTRTQKVWATRILLIGWLMAGATFSGCEETTLEADDAGNDIEVAQSMSAVTGTPYFYFRCNATGWGVDAATLMVETGTPGVYSIEFDIVEAWMIDTGDTCAITVTNELNGWGTEQDYYGLDYTHYIFQVPGEEQATLYVGGDPHFIVKYPSLGRFEARFDSNTLTLTIGDAVEASECTGTQTEIVDCLNEKLEHWDMDPSSPVPHIQITGVNVQVTKSESDDGTGNLIVGEDHIWTGSTEGFVAGYSNTITGTGNAVMGGRYNTADGTNNVVVGGDNNTATGTQTTVFGGQNNTSSFVGATVCGGDYNNARRLYATASGGSNNNADAFAACVNGGSVNRASAWYSVVNGGRYNQTTGNYSSIVGGWVNNASSTYSTVSGGAFNVASGSYASVAGGSDNEGVGENAVVIGGYSNEANGYSSVVCGGADNQANGDWSSVSGGQLNASNGDYSTVAGGLGTTTTSSYDWAAGDILLDL